MSAGNKSAEIERNTKCVYWLPGTAARSYNISYELGEKPSDLPPYCTSAWSLYFPPRKTKKSTKYEVYRCLRTKVRVSITGRTGLTTYWNTAVVMTMDVRGHAHGHSVTTDDPRVMIMATCS